MVRDVFFFVVFFLFFVKEMKGIMNISRVDRTIGSSTVGMGL